MVETVKAIQDLIAEVGKAGPNGIAILALIVALYAIRTLGRKT
jgi:hypothetical protein